MPIAETDRTRPQWAADYSLQVRLRDAVREMVRGADKYKDRMAYAAERLMPLTDRDFPIDLQHHYVLMWEIWKQARRGSKRHPIMAYGTLSAKRREAFTDALMALYDAAVSDRAILDRDRALREAGASPSRKPKPKADPDTP